MSCTFSRHTLALHVEGDLPHPIVDAALQHLEQCQECRDFFEQLQASQSLVKLLRRETVSPSECTGMRHDVMAVLNGAGRLGWALRVERVTTLTFRRHAYAVACAIVGIVSVSVLAQMRHAPASGTKISAAVFEGTGALLRPDDYRTWILVSDPAEPGLTGHAGTRTEPTPARKVYMDPEGYRAYAATGAFAEGTVMIWESGRGEPDATHPRSRKPALLASVKDSARFDGGWGFFDFAGPQGRMGSKATPSPESSGCRTCHLEEAETDAVFTQFYSALRSARHGQRRGEVSGRTTRPTDSFALTHLSRRAQRTLAHS